MKRYYISDSIGTARYIVNFHDGIQTHKDGSPFYGIGIFHSKKKRDAFIKALLENGYVEGVCI